MATYDKEIDYTSSSVSLKLKERSIYGSSRLGVRSSDMDMLTVQSHNYSMKSVKYEIGKRTYELSNHLGNVLSVISDKPIPSFEHEELAGMLADVRVAQDYSPFGVTLSGRNFMLEGAERGKFGFQGQEHDDEVKGKGNSVNFTYRMHDPRIGRFFAVDPLSNRFSYNSPYAFSENRVIDMIELEGLETSLPKTEFNNGHKIVTQAIDETGIQKQHLMTLPKVNLLEKKQEPQFKPRVFYIQSEQNEMTQRVELAKLNLDNWSQYVIPGGGILNKLSKGEDVEWSDIGVEAVAIIPIGKIFGAVGKAVLKSEFAEGAVKEVANFMKQNANEGIDVIKTRLSKSIKSYGDLITAHKGYIADPKKKYGDAWDTFSEKRKNNAIHHWKQDIKRHEAYKLATEAALKEVK